jgi:holin-like protein
VIIVKYLRSFAIVMACLLVGNYLQNVTGLAISGSIIGMLLLFLFLASGIVKPSWAKESSVFLVRSMMLLFIPVSVGLIDHLELLQQNALSILVSTAGGTLIMIVFLALLIQRLEGGRK